MKEVLITGFEPFGGDTINPSWEIAQSLDRFDVAGGRIHIEQLPVDAGRLPERLTSLIDQIKPNVLIMLGLASGRSAVNLERVAINILDFAIPDNSGQVLQDRPILPGGPAAYLSTLPIRVISRSMTQNGFPAVISNTAGTYLCNQAMYIALHELAGRPWRSVAGFIHVPALPAQVLKQSSPSPSMPLEMMIGAVKIAVEETIAALR